MKTFAAACALTLACAFAPVQAQEAVVVKDYDVYVDLPTAFAFIKLPTGWKFVGKLDADQLRHLPPDTLTALLPSESTSVQMAGDTQKQVRSKRGI